jgi:uncharacterized membrane protein
VLFVAGGCFFFFLSFVSLSYLKRYTFLLVVTHFFTQQKKSRKEKKRKTQSKIQEDTHEKSPKDYLN